MAVQTVTRRSVASDVATILDSPEVATLVAELDALPNGQRFLYRDGPERQTYSDPDASWGHRSAVSTRKGGGFYGYCIHAAVCAVTGLPLAWQIETARSHESMHVATLLDASAARGFKPATVAMDMGYDFNRIYAECAERGCAAIIPLRKNQGARDEHISRGSVEWRSLYRRRSAVEREFGRLKHTYGLATLRVRGIERVRLHAELTMLGRLALALAKARAAPTTASVDSLAKQVPATTGADGRLRHQQSGLGHCQMARDRIGPAGRCGLRRGVLLCDAVACASLAQAMASPLWSSPR